MFAFLKLIPVKDWLYVGAVVFLLTWGGCELHRHDVKVAAKAQAVIIAADTRVADAATKQIAAGTATAQTTEIANAQKYNGTATQPVSGVGIVCYHPGATAGRAVPKAGGVPAPGVGDGSPDGGVGPAYDPSGALLARARKADAQITYLQGRIHELETQMSNSP